MIKDVLQYTSDAGNDYDIHFTYGYNEVTGESRLLSWTAKYPDSNRLVDKKFNDSVKKKIENHLMMYLDERQSAEEFLDEVQEREMGVDELIRRNGW